MIMTIRPFIMGPLTLPMTMARFLEGVPVDVRAFTGSCDPMTE